MGFFFLREIIQGTTARETQRKVLIGKEGFVRSESPVLLLSPQVIVPATHFSPAVLWVMTVSCVHVLSD